MRILMTLAIVVLAACGDGTGLSMQECDAGLELGQRAKDIQSSRPQDAYVRMSDGDIFTPLTCSNLKDVVTFRLENQNLSSMDGLQYMVKLENVLMSGNRITDLSPLEDLDFLEGVIIRDNGTLTDVGPLLRNDGLTWGDVVALEGTAVSCSAVASLGAKGVDVRSDCGSVTSN